MDCHAGRMWASRIFFDGLHSILTKGGVSMHGTKMMRAAASFLIAFFAAAAPAVAAGPKIAVVAPTDGPLAILGKQVLDGARAAAQITDSEIIPIPEACDAAADAAIARAIIASDADAAIGFLCTEGLETALPALAESDIPALTLSVRSGILMEDAVRKGWPFFRLAPGPEAEAEKAFEVITSDWKAEPFALIDDGTIHARELVEAIRLKLEEVGMKPIFVDTFRPAQEQQLTLVRRLAKTGATRVFVGGDRTDTAIIARDAAAERLPMGFMGGEALVGADQTVAMPDGVLAVALPAYETLPDGLAATAALKENNIVAEGYVLPAHAAVTLLAAAAAAGGETLAKNLAGGRYDTAIGSVSFNAIHELSINPYRLLEWRDGAFRLADSAAESE
jgi:branched-chain amino acid transport system substrate-binding protein